MIYSDPIVNIMGDIVAKVGVNLLPKLQATNPEILSVGYLFGHPDELIETLKQKDKSPTAKFDKYPVVMLFTDIPETYPGDKSGYLQNVVLQMVIAYSTKADLKAADRLTKNFIPILLPIYQELMKQIYASGAFVIQSQKQIPHTKYDRYYWGKTGLYRNSGNVFSDFIDAIEIKDLKLRLQTKNPPFTR